MIIVGRGKWNGMMHGWRCLVKGECGIIIMTTKMEMVKDGNLIRENRKGLMWMAWVGPGKGKPKYLVVFFKFEIKIWTKQGHKWRWRINLSIGFSFQTFVNIFSLDLTASLNNLFQTASQCHNDKLVFKFRKVQVSWRILLIFNFLNSNWIS